LLLGFSLSTILSEERSFAFPDRAPAHELFVTRAPKNTGFRSIMQNRALTYARVLKNKLNA
jgi:hypothetical protein